VNLPGVNAPASPIIIGTKARVVTLQANPFARFQVDVSSGTATVSVTVGVTLKAQTIQLFRAINRDISTASLIQSWTGPFAAQQDLEFADTAATGTSFYWLRVVYDATTAQTQDIGPQIAFLTPVGQSGGQIQAFSASVTPGLSGTVTIGITFETPNVSDFASVQIIATGYNHITGQQVVAQSATSGFTFALKATGETVTLQANAVNLAGKTQPGGPTHTVHLVATATVPCVVYDAVATSVANGNQITWPQNPEPTTTYKVTRTSAGLIATVPHGTEAEVNFLDVCASPATQTYTIVAHTAAGDAAASPTITPGQQFLSAAQGTGATASALTVANGANKSVAVASITAAGSGYFAVPLVTFSGSSLSQDATGVANLDGAGHVASITIATAGLYATADTVALSIHY
jgi:hypothetical protein